MVDSTSPTLGSGAHGREFRALPAEKRAAIMERFNADNLRYFSGTMGFLVVDLREGHAAEAYVLRSSRRSAYAEVDIWSQGKLAARASTTYVIKPMSSRAEGND